MPFNKGEYGAAIGAGSWSIKTIFEKIIYGVDFAQYKQEILEDVTGAIISVTVGYFLMRFYKGIFKNKKDENTGT